MSPLLIKLATNYHHISGVATLPQLGWNRGRYSLAYEEEGRRQREIRVVLHLQRQVTDAICAKSNVNVDEITVLVL